MSTLDVHFFDRIDEERKAYWLGFIFAEGAFYDGNRTLAVSIELSHRDVAHLHKLAKDIKSETKITYRKRKGKTKDIELSRWKVCSKQLVSKLLRFFPAGPRSTDLVFPELESSLLRHFIRGYFDGDGSVFKRTGSNVKTTSKPFALELKNIFEGLGLDVKFTVTDRTHEGRKTLYTCRFKKHDTYTLLQWMYGNSSVYLDRKYERYLRNCPPGR